MRWFTVVAVLLAGCLDTLETMPPDAGTDAGVGEVVCSGDLVQPEDLMSCDHGIYVVDGEIECWYSEICRTYWVESDVEPGCFSYRTAECN